VIKVNLQRGLTPTDDPRQAPAMAVDDASTMPARACEAATPRPQTPREAFTKMDADLVRVLEDLVHVLIDKGVIALTDLPQHAQAKLLERKSFRDRVAREREAMLDADEINDALDSSRFGLMR
jgi:hypothetical protein